MAKYDENFFDILIVNISDSESSIDEIWKLFDKVGYPIISKQSDYF
jgi:hypothetical protein